MMAENWVGEITALRRKLAVDGSAALPIEDWPQEVLGFWFEELTPKEWFKKSRAVDGRIADLFLTTYLHVADGRADDDLAGSLEAARAAIIVLDQFPRNLFRGDPMSFATDRKALVLARRIIEARQDRDLAKDQRLFVYLPFEHSENTADQDRSVELISALGDDELTRYALAHREVIERFGRFPHRNAVLNRNSTAAEEDYLAEPGSGF